MTAAEVAARLSDLSFDGNGSEPCNACLDGTSSMTLLKDWGAHQVEKEIGAFSLEARAMRARSCARW